MPEPFASEDSAFEDARSEDARSDDDQIAESDARHARHTQHAGHDLQPPPPPPPSFPPDFRALYADAVRITESAVRQAEEDEEARLRDAGARLRAEQDRLHALVVSAIPEAVTFAASQGRRVATVLTFDGGDKFGEFCYLYMLKGPYKHEHRQEMRAMGASPLMGRIRDALSGTGFRLHHSWQRATNENILSVSW